MHITEKMATYKAFGLYIASEIYLPELNHIDHKEYLIDMEIKIGKLSRQWTDLSNKLSGFVIIEKHVLFKVPDVAIFSIKDGKTITVSPLRNADEDKIRLYILGTCMGVLLMQRKILPLHGSAVSINEKVYAFVGERGAGKSTLAATFLNKGYQLLSDDVIAVSLNEGGVPQVTPSYPQQKLWQDSLDHFNMESSHYHPLFERETKFSVPVHDRFMDKPLPLAGVFELVKDSNCIEKIELHPFQKLERLHTLFNHTYRSFLIQRLGMMEWHFQLLTQFVNKVDLAQLQRPESGFTANDLVSIVLDRINTEKLSI